mgnify:CR=1 FL=1
MAQTIKLKRSATAGAIPGTSDLELGEIALNTRDGAVYIKKNDGSSDSIVAVHDNDILHIDTSNSRIGIGTTSPSQALEVNGNIKLGDGHLIGDDATDNLVLNSSSGENIVLASAGNHFFNTGASSLTSQGTTRMIINNSGNVGIGTSSPDTKLDITTAGVQGILLNQDTSSASVSSRLFFKDSTRTNAIVNVNGNLELRTGATIGSSSGTKRLVVKGDGTITFNEAYTFPAADGSANQILKTDGSGTLTFADESGGGASGQIETSTMDGDGSDTTLTLTSAPTSEDNLIVFIDGVYQNKDSYTISSTTLTFDTAPDNGTKVVAHHIKTGIVGSVPTINTMTGDGSDTTLTLGTAPVSENATFVTIDGVVQHKSTYSVSGTTLTFSTAPPNGTAVECITFVNTTTTDLRVLQDADQDTKIQVQESSDEDKIRFDTAGTERMIIDNAGNVGVGTSSPAERLHVVGDVRVDTDLYIQPTNKFYLDGGNDTYISEAAANTMVFNTAGAERMRIKSNGFVGIGTTSPLDLLHIKSSSTDARLVMDGHTDADAEVKFAEAGSVKFTIGNDAATDSFVIGTTNVDTNKRFEINSSGVIKFNGAYTFPTSDGSANQVLQTDGSGALSFGTITTSDSTKLPLAGGTMTGALNMGSQNITAANRITLADGVVDSGQAGSSTVFNNDGTTADFRIESNSNTHMFFLDGGLNRIGIGTSNLNATLQVGDGTTEGDATNPAIQIGRTSTYRFGMYASTEGAVIENKNGDDGIQFRVKTAGEAMRIDGGTGNVGIGETTPLGKLHVKTADSGGSADGSADELVVEGSGNSGIQILSGASNNSTILFGDSGDSAAGRFRYEHDNNALNFGTNGAWDKMYLTSTGSVGIGTTSPTAKIHMKTTGTEKIGIAVQNSQRHYGIGTTSQNLLIEDISAGGTQRLVINPSGRVQIGTATTFNAGLHVSNGDIRTTSAAFANDANSLSMSWESSGIGYLTARGPSTSERGKLGLSVNRSNGAAGITGLLIDNDGAVLINTTVNAESQAMRIRQGGSNANAALSLDSDTGDQSYYRYMRFYRKGQTSSIAKLDIDFSASTIGLAYTSDERYKDITGDADGLNLISKLKPIKYKWKEGSDLGDGTETQGFGAQSYKQAFDDVGSHPRGVSVPEDEDTEKWTLDYTHLVPNLVKAIQELETEVTNLRARLTAEENK